MQPTRQEYILKSEVRKMIEKKQSEVSYHDNDNGENPMMYGERITEELLSELDNLTGVSGWIPVTERLPEGDALAISKYGDYLVGYVYTDGRYFGCEADETTMKDVTHWMPLPPHP